MPAFMAITMATIEASTLAAPFIPQSQGVRSRPAGAIDAARTPIGKGIPIMNPIGSKDAVRAFYDLTIVQTGAHRLEFACDRVIVDDASVFTEGVMRMAYPGKTLQAMGIEVDDSDAYYLSEARMGVVWPVDPEDERLTGEEVYSSGDVFEGIADRKISLADIVELEPAA